jgi:ankyrin repeat protein
MITTSDIVDLRGRVQEWFTCADGRVIPFKARRVLFGGQFDWDAVSIEAIMQFCGGDCNCIDDIGWPVLFAASLSGRADVVESLLHAGARVNAPNPNRVTPLVAACHGGRSIRVGSLVGVGVLRSDAERICPATVDYLATARLLIRAGADVHLADASGMFPLAAAVIAEREAIVAMLLDLVGGRTDATRVCSGDTTPLHAACRAGSSRIVSMLLGCGADKDAPDPGGLTPLHCACANDCREVVEVLLAAGAKQVAGGTSGIFPLHVAISNDKIEAVTLLLRAGADPNASTEFGRTPLVQAMLQDQESCMSLLLNHGANPNKVAGSPAPLQTAIDLGNTRFVGMLLNAGADPGQPDGDGTTPLVHILYQANKGPSFEKIARMLICAGAAASNRCTWCAPLASACTLADPTVAMMLLRAGADKDAPIGKESPLEIATERGHTELAFALVVAGASLKVGVKCLNELLARAAKCGNAGVIDMLLRAGADPTLRDGGGATPLIAAIAGGFSIAATVLAHAFERRVDTLQRGLLSCTVCNERTKAVVLQPCGHVSTCAECWEKIAGRGDPRCPICRAPVGNAMKVYIS